jgi:hypothetical protein
VDDHRSNTPGQSQGSDLPAKVPRRVVGGPQTGPPPEETRSVYKPHRSWDKLLLVLGAAVVVVALLVVPGILNRRGENPIAAAAQATQDAPGVRMSFSATSQGPVPMSMTGAGVMNGETNRASIEVKGSVPTEGGQRAFTLDEVVSEFDLYMHSPELMSGALGTTKSWILLRSEAFGDLFKDSSSGVSAGMSMNPSQELDSLQSASDNVSVVGRERIGRTVATHYSAVIDPDKLRDELKSRVSGNLEELVDRSMDQLSGESVDVWIDDQGLIRRASTSTTTVSLGTMNTTVDFTDYGIHPDIQVPPESEVFDVTPLLERALGG